MNFINQIERLNKVHHLIHTEKTGTPIEFANKLKLSRSQLYNILEYFKDFDASIKYCKKRQSFYYAKSFDLRLHFQFEIILEGEARKISGGLDFCPIILAGSILNLSCLDKELQNQVGQSKNI